MDIYFAYHLHTKDEIVIALLSDLGFESFVEEDELTTAYINDVTRTEEVKKHHRTDFVGISGNLPSGRNSATKLECTLGGILHTGSC